MKRGYGLIVAAGVSALLLTIGQASFAQTESDFVNGLRPIPKVLQRGQSGLPIIGPAARAPRDTNYQSTSAEGPPVAAHVRTGGESARVRPHPAEKSVRTAGLPGCRATPDTSGKPQVSSNRISFEFGSAVLTPQAKQVLSDLGKALNGQLRNEKAIEIDGHTDAVGSFEYNDELSKLRADAAKEFLVHEMGVAPDRLKVVGRSYCEPADPSHPDSAANRRVVVVNQAG
jgi:outer membrane protein OmpA-like peptidoglycan-associated protein